MKLLSSLEYVVYFLAVERTEIGNVKQQAAEEGNTNPSTTDIDVEAGGGENEPTTAPAKTSPAPPTSTTTTQQVIQPNQPSTTTTQQGDSTQENELPWYKKYQTPIIVALVLVILGLIAAIVAVVVTQNNDSSRADGSTSQQPVAPPLDSPAFDAPDTPGTSPVDTLVQDTSIVQGGDHVEGYTNLGRGSCQDSRGEMYSYLQRTVTFPNAGTCGKQECERFGNLQSYRGFEYSVAQRCTCLFDIDELPALPNDAEDPEYESKRMTDMGQWLAFLALPVLCAIAMRSMQLDPQLHPLQSMVAIHLVNHYHHPLPPPTR